VIVESDHKNLQRFRPEPDFFLSLNIAQNPSLAK